MPKILDAVPAPKQATPPLPSVTERVIDVVKVHSAISKVENMAAVAKSRPVVFPDLMINGVKIPRENLRVTDQRAREIIGYETETQYFHRRVCEDYGKGQKMPPGETRASWCDKLLSATRTTTETDIEFSERKQKLREKVYVFKTPGLSPTKKDKDGQTVVNPEFVRLANAPEYHFIDPNGDKVVCWFNVANRELREGWVNELGQEIGGKRWRFNCETMIVSKTRLVLSAQHRLIALIWTVIRWRAGDPDIRAAWGDVEPYIESLVVLGADEDRETLMTYDANLARTDADNYIQTAMFEDWTRKVPAKVVGPDGNSTMTWVDGPLSTPQKRECARYLDACVQTLWDRTDAEGKGAGKPRYKSKTAVIDFIRQHPTLLACVRHMFEENSSDERAISSMRLSPGQCAAMCYLMATGQNDGKKYRDVGTPSARTEEGLDFSRLDKAREFFTLLANSDPASGTKTAREAMAPVRHALGMIEDPEKCLGGTPEEKQAVIAKAWRAWYETGAVLDTDVSLRYKEDREPSSNGTPGKLNKRWLDECPTFGGIDLGFGKAGEKPATTAPKAPTVTDVEKEKEAARKRREQLDAQAARTATAPQPQPEQTEAQKVAAMRSQMESFKSTWPGKLIVIRHPSTALLAHGTDAMLVANTLGLQTTEIGDLSRVTINVPVKPSVTKVLEKHDNAIILERVVVNGQTKYHPRSFRELIAPAATWIDGTPVV